MPSSEGTIRSRPRWRRRFSLLFRSRRLVVMGEPLAIVVLLAVAGITYSILIHGSPDRPLPPFLVALLLVGNLVPAMALLVLIAQRIARGRAEQSPLGGRGGLHVRLVATFSVLTAVPTLLVVIFASLLFQFGVRFWFSDRASVVLQNADKVVQTYINEHRTDLWRNATAMRSDLLYALSAASHDDPRWATYFAQQVAWRNLTQAAVIHVAPDKSEQVIWLANLDKRPEQVVDPDKLTAYDAPTPHVFVRGDRMETVVPLDPATRTYLWISRHADPFAIRQA